MGRLGKLSAPMFWRAFRNTLIISFQNLLIGFPIPILFALLVNEIRHAAFKKTVQTISYLPHFISWSVVGGLVYMLLSLNTGTVNNVIEALGGTPQNFTGMNAYFRGIVVVSGIWKSMGWSAIVYLAAITGVDEELYEAASIDGAGKWRQFFSVTVPLITPVIFYNLITQLCEAFQEFNSAFIITKGGPLGSTTLISLLIYQNAFRTYEMGLASAMAWLLFIIICTLTVASFASQKYWVYYSDDER